jgi:lipopolysaccharide export LptBFGC system permease protein LptF
MGFALSVASIDNSTLNIDSAVANAIESDNTSNLKPILNETQNIRDKTKEIRQRFEKILASKAKLEKKLEQETKMIWVELAYQFAPLLLGLVSLIIGRLTNNPSDTKFGFVCFFLGFLMTAMYQTIGYWGIVGIGVLILGYLFYSHERNDLVKKSLATTLSYS